MSDSKNSLKKLNKRTEISRREVIASGAALATTAGMLSSLSHELRAESKGINKNMSSIQAPYDSLRDYVNALEESGSLKIFDGVNQDKYEGTAIMYQLIDEFGLRNAPAVLLRNVIIDGKNVKGPIVANFQGPMITEAMLLGTKNYDENPKQTYRDATSTMLELLRKTEGEWPEIAPREIAADVAPCKQNILRGGEIDMTKFAFIKGNPGDGGRYINTASVVTSDPDLGGNYGIYRCQLKGPRKIMINFEDGQTGKKMIDAALKRGETKMKIALVVGQDPMTFMISCSRIPSRIGRRDPIDELAVAGGLRGKAIDVVKTEDQNFLVPANAEMIIEGTFDLLNLEPEGPYHEMYGYLGHPKPKNYVMTVETLTHRTDPWIINSFTGVVQEYISAPQRAESNYRLQQSSPQVVDYHSPHESQGITFMSIKKDAAKQALKIARPTAMFNPLSRIVIVVDEDVDVLDTQAVLFALGSRWQPALASEIIENR
ncbi:MAG: UbiD family decarboxylase, partial [Pseudomonadota bacterium]|nr:UbiD family decarboxylase [Pseudomonadota bacterium]